MCRGTIADGNDAAATTHPTARCHPSGAVHSSFIITVAIVCAVYVVQWRDLALSVICVALTSGTTEEDRGVP